MAAYLGISKGTLQRQMRELGLGGRREVTLVELFDLELCLGKAGRLLGRSWPTMRRWYRAGKLPLPHPHDQFAEYRLRRIKLRAVLDLRGQVPR